MEIRNSPLTTTVSTPLAETLRQRRAKEIVQELLRIADVRIDGINPWDIHVHNPDFFARLLQGGVLGLGESYMDGWWDCAAVDQLFYRILSADLRHRARKSWATMARILESRVMNLQSRSRAYQIAHHHYDLGNELFTNMLDRRMVYSCGYWRQARTLDEAQEAKLDLVCRKLNLKHGMRVLDVGCGWGSFARYAAEHYGVNVVGITVSDEQVTYAREYCKGFPVEIRLQDYRSLDDTFHRVVSIGMFEHVGHKNYRTFMEVVRRSLVPDGLLLLHTIGSHVSTTLSDPWTEKYIFPNGNTPSMCQIATASEGLFVIEDVHVLGSDYDPTLMAWHQNFVSNWHKIQDRYDERFFRMWTYFLLSCAGSFRARHTSVWQIVMGLRGVRGGYISVR